MRARRCAEQPIVFTAQGGMQPHAEAAINNIAAVISKAESKPLGIIKAEIVQDIFRTLARAAARAGARRAPRPVAGDVRERRLYGEGDTLEA